MATNNVQLFDAALASYMESNLAGRYILDATAADYLALTNAAAAFAAAVDAAIPADAALITPVDKYTLAHVNLLKAIATAALTGGYSSNTIAQTQATWNAVAAAIKAAYVEAALLLQ